MIIDEKFSKIELFEILDFDFFFFNFFTQDVLKSLLRGLENIRKKRQVPFEKFAN